MGYAVGTQDTVGMQYAVGVSAKRSNHTVDLVNGGGGTITFSAKRSTPTQWVRSAQLTCSMH